MSTLDATQGNGKPFFGYLAFQVAHSPFMTPPGTMEKYDQIYSAGWEKVREQRFEKQKDLGIWPANMTLSQGLPPNVAVGFAYAGTKGLCYWDTCSASGHDRKHGSEYWKTH